nr:serine/arginine repetitive matrix protein 2-like [Ipomoea batatas]
MGWSCNRLGEQIAEDILRKQTSAAERRIQELEKELAAAEDRAEKAEKKLGEAEARADKAEKAEQEAMDKMKDASSVARFIYTDEAIAREFLTAFINTEVGDKLTWVYGQCAFSSGCQAIEEKVHTALVEGLEESDFPAVMALLPDKLINSLSCTLVPPPSVFRPSPQLPFPFAPSPLHAIKQPEASTCGDVGFTLLTGDGLRTSRVRLPE